MAAFLGGLLWHLISESGHGTVNDSAAVPYIQQNGNTAAFFCGLLRPIISASHHGTANGSAVYRNCDKKSKWWHFVLHCCDSKYRQVITPRRRVLPHCRIYVKTVIERHSALVLWSIISASRHSTAMGSAAWLYIRQNGYTGAFICGLLWPIIS